jgi:hypothetical protein
MVYLTATCALKATLNTVGGVEKLDKVLRDDIPRLEELFHLGLHCPPQTLQLGDISIN